MLHINPDTPDTEAKPGFSPVKQLGKPLHGTPVLPGGHQATSAEKLFHPRFDGVILSEHESSAPPDLSPRASTGSIPFRRTGLQAPCGSGMGDASGHLYISAETPPNALPGRAQRAAKRLCRCGVPRHWKS